MQDFFQRYADRVTPGEPDACWPWTGAVASGGYGHTNLRNAHVYAHRAAYESVHGVGSADGLVVRHRCDNPPCCNPGHLELGTHADNARDMRERGRAVDVRGVDVNTAKLSEDQVLWARSRFRDGLTVAQILRHLPIKNHTTLAKAIRGETWRHLPGSVR